MSAPPAVGKLRLLGNGFHLSDALIEARNVSLVVGGIHDIRVWRIRCDVSRFASAYVIPVGAVDGAFVAAARDANGGVILLRSVNPIRHRIVGNDMVELRRRLIILARPVLATIQSHSHAAVVRRDHALGIHRIDPQAVVVAVRNFYLIEQVPAIGGFDTLRRP